MPRGNFLDCCCQCPCSCAEPLLPHISPGHPPNTWKVVLAHLLGHCSFSLGPGACNILFVSSKIAVCFPQSCGNPIIKSCWPSRPDFLGILSPFVGPPAWKVWGVVQNLHNSGRTNSVLLFSSLWVTTWRVWNFIVIAPLLPSRCGFFVFDVGNLFGGFQHPPVSGWSTTSCDFDAHAEGDARTF